MKRVRILQLIVSIILSVIVLMAYLFKVVRVNGVVIQDKNEVITTEEENAIKNRLEDVSTSSKCKILIHFFESEVPKQNYLTSMISKDVFYKDCIVCVYTKNLNLLSYITSDSNIVSQIQGVSMENLSSQIINICNSVSVKKNNFISKILSYDSIYLYYIKNVVLPIYVILLSLQLIADIKKRKR